MFNDLLALLSGDGDGVAVYDPPAGGGLIRRSQLAGDIELLSGCVRRADRAAGEGKSAWICCEDRYLLVTAAVGCLRSGPVALVDSDSPPAACDMLAAASPPAVLVSDSGGTEAARWAVAHGIPVRLIARPADGWRPAGDPAPDAVSEPVLQFSTSGTTGPVKCVGLGHAQLLAAVTGVADRLGLTGEDISLSAAPLTHTLGFVTTVLVGLAAGGAVAFADPLRPRSLLTALAQTHPSWCAASPSALRLIHDLTCGAGRKWPGLRFLRSSAAALPGELAADLEGHLGVPVINAYAMTEAPGEIASQDLDGPRRPGTVGRPTLCEVDIRPGQASDGAEGGEIWIRGRNVAVPHQAPSDELAWLPTGDIGVLDGAGFLRITGRRHDIINSGGLKIWPPEVEAAALAHPRVAAAAAFPVPHRGLGETVGLAVVPRAGQPLDRSAIRRWLMSTLPRGKWPATIVVCGQLPLGEHGKLSRRRMWQELSAAAPVPAAGGVEGQPACP